MVRRILLLQYSPFYLTLFMVYFQMIRRCRMVVLGLLSGCMLLVTGCAQNPDLVHKKLLAIAHDDLAGLIDEMPSESVADSTYYQISEFKTFDEGTYRAKAAVEFYLLKSVHTKVVRKYRYHHSQGQWERYYNKYQYY